LTDAAADRVERLVALLGLARNAGKLAVGVSAVEEMVRKGRRPLLVVATDAGAGLRARAQRWQPVRRVLADAVSGADLARALGRDKLSVVGVCDPGFVQGIEKIGF